MRARGAAPLARAGGAPGSRAASLSFACLGSSGAVPSAARDTTALVVRAGRTTCLVDVGGSPVQKLRRVGIDPVGLSAVVVTHTHPDHVYGLPALVQCLLILGRTAAAARLLPGRARRPGRAAPRPVRARGRGAGGAGRARRAAGGRSRARDAGPRDDGVAEPARQHAQPGGSPGRGRRGASSTRRTRGRAPRSRRWPGAPRRWSTRRRSPGPIPPSGTRPRGRRARSPAPPGSAGCTWPTSATRSTGRSAATWPPPARASGGR